MSTRPDTCLTSDHQNFFAAAVEWYFHCGSRKHFTGESLPQFANTCIAEAMVQYSIVYLDGKGQCEIVHFTDCTVQYSTVQYSTVY